MTKKIVPIFFFFLIICSLYSQDIQDSMTTLQHLQEHDPQVFQHLSPDEQRELLNQIQDIDLSLLMKAKEMIQHPQETMDAQFDSFDDFAFSGNAALKEEGQALINQGAVGCVVLGGGQGTRLKFHGPKGLYPISVIKQKSLFQMCAEKVLAASKLAGYPLKIAFMTSPENDEATRLHFEENHYFGLSPNQISFFVQETFPLLNVEGKVFLEKRSLLSTGPAGNGHWLLSFVKSGLWQKWMLEGTKFINIILVDNPLADPYDSELIGFHVSSDSDITVKCTEKNFPKEPVGVLVKQNDRCIVVEYSELPEEEKIALHPNGKLKHCCANLSLFCFSMTFIKQMHDEGYTLPFHKAWKSAYYLDDEGNTVQSKEPMAWKLETFIFDWLPYASKVAALLYPREECFAPLKNFSGPDSPDTVRAALQAADRKCIQNITQQPPPEFPFELAADFYYPTESLKDKWLGKIVSTPYVAP